MTSSERRLLLRVVQYGIGLAAIAWLAAQIELTRLANLTRNVGAPTVAAILAVTGIGLLARFSLWYVLVSRVTRSSLRAAASVDLAVNFVNQLLPSRLSGRAAAPLVLRSRTGIGYPDAVAVAGVHTGLYALCYGIVASVGVALGAGALPSPLLTLVALSTGLYLLAGGFVLIAGMQMAVSPRPVEPLAGVLRRLPRVGDRLGSALQSLPAFSRESADRFRSLGTDPAVLIPYSVGFVGVMLVASGGRVWLVVSSFGTSFEPALMLPVYLLAAYSVTMLPLTPGGIGVSEATATAVFVALGVPAAVIVPAVFVDRLLGVYLPAIAGWYPVVRLDLTGTVVD